jgi:hypothetical protein
MVMKQILLSKIFLFNSAISQKGNLLEYHDFLRKLLRYHDFENYLLIYYNFA